MLRRVGIGSYGEVWLARNVLGDYRAVKVVYRNRFEHERPYEREFDGIRKFEPISRLHDSQVDILHVGRNDEAGCFYYAMELADDASAPAPAELKGITSIPDPSNYTPRTLKLDLHRRNRLSVDECLSIGLALTTAVQHLHEHGLVHRDIKPSNIIFVGGVPKLADIGLVASMDQTMSFVGTSGYLPPEGPGTPQADLYSLGKVLYEISTGRDRTDFPKLPPELLSESENAECGTRGDASRSTPHSESHLKRLLELNAVILKACHRDPRQRYQSAQEMAADLSRLQAGKSVRRTRGIRRVFSQIKKVALFAILLMAAILIYNRPLDPLTTGKNVGGYPPTVMRGTTNVNAWEYYKRAYWDTRRTSQDGFVQAKRYLEKAIELDPNFALAYFPLWMKDFGDTWYLTHAKTDEFQRRADKLARLDIGLAETHVVLGLLRFWEWKWQESEAEYHKALDLNPDCIDAYILLGFMLSHVGRTEESLEILDRGLRVDPSQPQLVKMKGHAYFVRRQFQQALDLYQQSFERTLFADGHNRAARAYIALTNYPYAIMELETTNLLRPGDHDAVRRDCSDLLLAFERDGPPGYWCKQLEMAEQRWSPEEYPYTYAELYARLENKEKALIFLENALKRHDELVYLIMDEFWDPWRDEPRFEAVRIATGLPRHPNFPGK